MLVAQETYWGFWLEGYFDARVRLSIFRRLAPRVLHRLI